MEEEITKRFFKLVCTGEIKKETYIQGGKEV